MALYQPLASPFFLINDLLIICQSEMLGTSPVI